VFIDSRPCMILDVQCWDRIVKEPQKKMQNQFSWNDIMCKNNWNFLNFNYKKLVEYHIGIGNHTYLQELIENIMIWLSAFKERR